VGKAKPATVSQGSSIKPSEVLTAATTSSNFWNKTPDKMEELDGQDEGAIVIDKDDYNDEVKESEAGNFAIDDAEPSPTAADTPGTPGTSDTPAAQPEAKATAPAVPERTKVPVNSQKEAETVPKKDKKAEDPKPQDPKPEDPKPEQRAPKSEPKPQDPPHPKKEENDASGAKQEQLKDEVAKPDPAKPAPKVAEAPTPKPVEEKPAEPAKAKTGEVKGALDGWDDDFLLSEEGLSADPEAGEKKDIGKELDDFEKMLAALDD